MKTATRVLVLASLLGAACSGGVDEGTDPSAAGPNSSIDPVTGAPIDPVTGVPIDPAPGDPNAGPVDPVTGEPLDPVTGEPVAPSPDDNTAEPTTPGPNDGPIDTECAPGIPATSQVPRLLNREYDAVVRDLLGVTVLSSGAPPSSLLNDDYDGPIDTFVWNAYQDAARTISAEVIASPNKSNFISCDPAAEATCYETTIRDFGRKAFRRPLSDEEVARFMTLTAIEPAGTPDEIATALLEAFLVSPSFIMVPEMASEAEGDAFKLSSYEVATRLSLMLWGSIPDDALNAAADADQLQDSAQILEQAERMLQVRDKAGPQIAFAHRAYLVMDEASHWWKVSHDSAVFPEYSAGAVPALQGELDAFFEEVAFSGGSFQDIYLSNIGFVNQQTAALYGLDPAGYGAELTKVELTDRPGFLTRAGFLSSFANADVTSPILRGAFITVNLLGVNPGAPDPDALTTPVPPGDYTTRRQQVEALTEPSDCASCHAPLVNPPGFVLENYNAVGAWQTVDPLGGTIDPTATVVFNADNTKEIASAQEMMQEIANNAPSRRIYAERLVSYFTGRSPNANDACVVDELDTKLAANDYTVLDLLADLTQADSLRLRTVGN